MTTAFSPRVGLAVGPVEVELRVEDKTEDAAKDEDLTELEKPTEETEEDPRIVLEPKDDEDRTEVKKILDADPELEAEELASMELTTELVETRSELDVVIEDKTDDETRIGFDDEDEKTVEDFVCEDDSKLELASTCDEDLTDDVATTDELFGNDEELDGIIVDEVIDVDLTELELLRTLEDVKPVDEVRAEVVNEDTVEAFELACTVEDDQVM